MVLRCTLLLAVLLAASAATAAQSGSPNSGPPMGFYPKVKPPAAGTTFSAVVKSNGTLVRGSGATAAMQAEGGFEVDFTNDVSQCAFVATIGQTGSSGFQSAGLISVVGRSGVPQAVYISTATRTGKTKYLPFHLDVGC